MAPGLQVSLIIRLARNSSPESAPSAGLAFLLLLTLACPGLAHEAAPPVPARLTLAGFEQLTAKELRQSWQSHGGTAIRLSLESSERGGKQAQVLRMDYRLPPDPGAQHEVEAVLPLYRLDASGYDHVSFMIREEPGSGPCPRLMAGFRRPHPRTAGLLEVGRLPVNGSGEGWQRVALPLNRMIALSGRQDLADFHIALSNPDAHPAQGTLFVDDIALVRTGQPGPSVDDKVATPAKEAWERTHGGPINARKALKARLRGWPAHFLISPGELPQDGHGFLRRLARDTWRGIDALSDAEHGLPLDRVRLPGSTADDDVVVGDYASTTDMGLYLLAVAAAHELALIDRPQALSRLRQTLTSLERMETYQGFHYNYYDTTTLERTSHFISFVDSAWLTAALLVTRSAFPELAQRCGALLDREDYGFFYDAQRKQMAHGFYVNLEMRSPFHYGLLYTEARLGSLIAIGKGDAPPEHWFALERTLPASAGWQSRPPVGRRRKTAHGFHWIGGHYHRKGLRYVPSWGGSLFEALMPTLLLDEQRHAPASLGRNGRVHSEAQRRYALDELGYPVWGLSPSSTPGSDGYAEFGVPFLGVLGYPAGIVTPHASALALATAPEAALSNLRRLADLYPLYGEYGFYDAVEPRLGATSYQYLFLDQAMILVALANHLTDHSIQRHFAADPVVRRILPLIGFESFLD